MKPHVRFLLVVIALTVVLVPLLSDLVRDVVLIELLRIAWTTDRLVDSLPQAPFWIAFLFVAMLVAALSLLPRLGVPGHPSEPAPRAQGQVADLALLIRRAGRQPYFRRRLVQRLSHLGREVFAHKHRVELEPGDGPVAAGQGLLFAAGGRYATGRFAQAQKGGEALHRSASLQQALADLHTEPTAPRGAVDPAVEFFIQFLEEELEVDDGRFDRSRR
ncbi:MAG TPA: hypothetical protein VLC95_00685 [Anaerolineae bacterium]|nr:hypothetical protein [Anaerolineae bacterium]